MSRKSKTENSSLSDHEAYRNGRMNERERNAFEKRLEADPFEMEAAEGFSSISEDHMKEDIERLHRRLDQRISKRGFPIWYRISAAAVVLLVITSVFLVRELRRPEMMVSDNIQAPGKGLIDKMEEPEPDLNEVSEKGKNELPEEQYDRATEAKSVIITENDEQTEELVKEVSPEKAEGLGLKGEVLIEDRLAMVVAEEIRPDSLVTERATAIAPVAGVADKSMSKRAKMAEAAPSVYTERKMVKGIVTSSDDMLPLPGVSVTIKGTSRGVVTDINGFFEIDADSNQALVASFIGMETREINISDNELENIILKPDMMSLDEVVVMAYSTKEELAGVKAGDTRADAEYEGLVYIAPVPAGGMESYRSYIEDNIIFPSDYTLADREVVRIRFIVSPGKAPYGFEILRSPAEQFNKEAIRLISEGPDWNPATSNGEPFEDKVSLRIVFRRK